MFSITVAEASAKLGVSPARVRQLIKSGVLAARTSCGHLAHRRKERRGTPRAQTPVAADQARA